MTSYFDAMWEQGVCGAHRERERDTRRQTENHTHVRAHTHTHTGSRVSRYHLKFQKVKFSRASIPRLVGAVACAPAGSLMKDDEGERGETRDSVEEEEEETEEKEEEEGVAFLGKGFSAVDEGCASTLDNSKTQNNRKRKGMDSLKESRLQTGRNSFPTADKKKKKKKRTQHEK